MINNRTSGQHGGSGGQLTAVLTEIHDADTGDQDTTTNWAKRKWLSLSTRRHVQKGVISSILHVTRLPTTFFGQTSGALIMAVTVFQCKYPISTTVAGTIRSGEDSRIGLRILSKGMGEDMTNTGIVLA